MTAGPDDGVLGNLPRSRPGNRSSKRDSPKRAKRPEAAVPAAPEPIRAGPRAEEPPSKAASAGPSQIEPGAPPTLLDMGARATEAWIGIVWFWPRAAMHLTSAVLRRLPRIF